MKEQGQIPDLASEKPMSGQPRTPVGLSALLVVLFIPSPVQLKFLVLDGHPRNRQYR